MASDDPVFLITGASTGIGAATARAAVAAGHRVVLTARSEDKLRALAEELGGDEHAIAVRADVIEWSDNERQAQAALDAFGRLDVVFANAGINGVWAPIDELRPEEWDRTIRTNLTGTFLTLHHAVPHLKRAGGGSVIITASINGTRTFTSPGATAYSCTKAAQVAMTKMLALELARHRIRVNVVCPGAIETEIDENTSKRDTEAVQAPVEYPDGKVPLTKGEPGTSEEVAELVLFLASERSRHITGTPVWIDGGQSLMV